MNADVDSQFYGVMVDGIASFILIRIANTLNTHHRNENMTLFTNGCAETSRELDAVLDADMFGELNSPVSRESTNET